MANEEFDQSQADDSTDKQPAEEDMDIYEKDQAEEMTEEDEIEPEEEGFMKGYSEGKKSAKCSKCNKILEQDIVEKDVEGEIYRFCSEKCAEDFKPK